MSSELGGAGAGGPSPTAGALLRAAREKQGLHIAALAASIKVAPRKLDALEHDRYEELSGAIFTRALAQSVCRALRVDDKPVLALLPPAQTVDLSSTVGNLNAPFRERPSRDEPGVLAVAQRSLVWAGLALLLAAVATYFVPLSMFKNSASAPTAVTAPESPNVPAAMAAAGPSPAASGAANIAVLPTPEALTAESANAGAAAAPDAPTVPASVVQITATESSWVEVRDGKGNLLLSRIVQPSAPAALDGQMPLRLVIGNAGVTQVLLRGKPVDMAAGTRDNVARLELN